MALRRALPGADDPLFCGLVPACSRVRIFRVHQASPAPHGHIHLDLEKASDTRAEQVRTGGRHTQLTQPSEEAQTQVLSGSCVCSDPLGAGGDPFPCGSREAPVFLRTLYFPLQAASVFTVLMNSRRSYRTYQDPGLSPFKPTSNDVMATEHRGFQKPQACCGHKLEHSLSRARREESMDKFFPPGSPPTGMHSAQSRLETWVSMAT